MKTNKAKSFYTIIIIYQLREKFNNDIYIIIEELTPSDINYYILVIDTLLSLELYFTYIIPILNHLNLNSYSNKNKLSIISKL